MDFYPLTNERQATMENPWKALEDKAPFILKCDKEAIEDLKKKYGKNTSKVIHTELPPEPYSGNKDAPLVLLWNRPNFNPRDDQFMLKNKNFRESMRKTRLHEPQEYPFYHLNDDNAYQNNPGFQLWSKKLWEVLQAKKYRYKSCADSIFLLQYFPYKSTKRMDTFLPSQKYSVYLLRQTMNRNASIVIMSSETLWKKAVPELKDYKNIFYCKNVRIPTISKGNIKDSSGNPGFDKILELIP